MEATKKSSEITYKDLKPANVCGLSPRIVGSEITYKDLKHEFKWTVDDYIKWFRDYL